MLLQSCPKLTHLSLTGIQQFYNRDDLVAFCREAPAEFNDDQRVVFCVFSGDGVSKLRNHLRQEDVGYASNLVFEGDDTSTIMHADDSQETVQGDTQEMSGTYISS